MILGFVVILSVVGTLLALSLYANLLPFIGLVGDVKQYNTAYYGAQSALERSLLVLRMQDAGFQGQGGTIDYDFYGPISDKFVGSDALGPFGKQVGTMYWHIFGRGSSVPLSGGGNIPYNLLSPNQNNDYNVLSYTVLQKLLLGYDATPSSSAYYNDSSDQLSYISLSGDVADSPHLSLFIRRNPIIYNLLGGVTPDIANLDTLYDIDGDSLKDDVAVDRSRKGQYDTPTASGTFHILPKARVSYFGGDAAVLSGDQFIRESIFNTTANSIVPTAVFGGGDNEFSPVAGVAVPGYETRSDNPPHLTISDNQNISTIGFTDLLSNIILPGGLRVFGQSLELSLINPLWTEGDGTQKSIYPFVEYRIECDICHDIDGSPQFSQPYFTINAQSKVGNYEVRMQLQRSAFDDSAIAGFTVIF